MKCPYCKHELNSLIRQVYVIQEHATALCIEDGRPVLRSDLLPYETRVYGHRFRCPNCRATLTGSFETAGEILKDGK